MTRITKFQDVKTEGELDSWELNSRSINLQRRDQTRRRLIENNHLTH